MSEVKTNWAAGEQIEASVLNSQGEEINKNGAVKDDIDGGETISGATTPQASFIKEADGELYACDANDLTKLKFVGFVISDTTDGNPADLRASGVVAGFTGLTPGAKYYVQDDKSIGTTPGTYYLLVGVAISATELLIIKENKLFYSEAISGNKSFTDSEDYDIAVACGFRPSKITVIGHFKYNTAPKVALNPVIDSANDLFANMSYWLNGIYVGYTYDATTPTIGLSTAHLIQCSSIVGDDKINKITIADVANTGFNLHFVSASENGPHTWYWDLIIIAEN